MSKVKHAVEKFERITKLIVNKKKNSNEHSGVRAFSPYVY